MAYTFGEAFLQALQNTMAQNQATADRYGLEQTQFEHQQALMDKQKTNEEALYVARKIADLKAQRAYYGASVPGFDVGAGPSTDQMASDSQVNLATRLEPVQNKFNRESLEQSNKHFYANLGQRINEFNKTYALNADQWAVQRGLINDFQRPMMAQNLEEAQGEYGARKAMANYIADPNHTLLAPQELAYQAMYQRDPSMQGALANIMFQNQGYSPMVRGFFGQKGQLYPQPWTFPSTRSMNAKNGDPSWGGGK